MANMATNLITKRQFFIYIWSNLLDRLANCAQGRRLTFCCFFLTLSVSFVALVAVKIILVRQGTPWDTVWPYTDSKSGNLTGMYHMLKHSPFITFLRNLCQSSCILPYRIGSLLKIYKTQSEHEKTISSILHTNH